MAALQPLDNAFDANIISESTPPSAAPPAALPPSPVFVEVPPPDSLKQNLPESDTTAESPESPVTLQKKKPIGKFDHHGPAINHNYHHHHYEMASELPSDRPISLFAHCKCMLPTHPPVYVLDIHPPKDILEEKKGDDQMQVETKVI